jgi:FAD dependent oxidoreductase TIGR03364
MQAPVTQGGLDASTDVAIVGAGILGLAHAAAAVKRGLRVTVFERSDIAVGASIRNFGQMLVTGQPPGIMLDLARESRALYLDWANKAGIFARANGALLFARNAAEEAVLDEFMATRAPAFGYNVKLLRSADLANLYDGRFMRHRAALQGFDDLQLYSREAIPALASWLATQGVRFHFGTLVRHVEGGRLETTAGVCNAQRVVVCSGHDYQTLCADQLRALQPQVCRLQMLRVTPEDGFRLEHAVLTGLSCTHYGAFADLPTAQALAMQIEHQRPELARHGIHLLVSPRHMATGSLAIRTTMVRTLARSTPSRSTTSCSSSCVTPSAASCAWWSVGRACTAPSATYPAAARSPSPASTIAPPSR